jgi:hypothetical protein
MGSLQEALQKVGMAKGVITTPAFEKEYFNGVIPVAEEKMGVLIFDVYPGDVPEDVQVVSMAGGVMGAPAQDEVRRCRFATLDFESFLEQTSIVTVSVVGNRDKYCRVYVNYEMDTTRPGFNYWANTSYERLVRKLGTMVWEKSAVYYGTKTRVTFSGRRSNTREPDLRLYFERG